MMNENCPCKTASCPRHGRCDECTEYHNKFAKNPLTACKQMAASAQVEARESNTSSEEVQ